MLLAFLLNYLIGQDIKYLPFYGDMMGKCCQNKTKATLFNVTRSLLSAHWYFFLESLLNGTAGADRCMCMSFWQIFMKYVRKFKIHTGQHCRECGHLENDFFVCITCDTDRRNTIR